MTRRPEHDTGHYILAVSEMNLLLLYILVFSVHSVLSLTDGEKFSALEKRVADLEKTLSSLEPLFVERYGLIRHCTTPVVQHGEANCPDKLDPGAKCSLVCNPGYIATPGKEGTQCQEDGFWTKELQCEIPLVMVAGGAEGEGASRVELISMYPSTGCAKDIAEMPLIEGAPRSLHNLLYVPPERVLACNGMATKNEATCDALDISQNIWKHHSYPNKGDSMSDAFCDIDSLSSRSSHLCTNNPDRKKGRYAAAGIHVGGETIIAGGMVYDGEGHEPSSAIRKFGYDSWTSLTFRGSEELRKERAFFCAVKVKESGFLSIGGLSQGHQGNVVEQSAEYRRVKGGMKSIGAVSDMSIPRSGHGCSGLPGDDISILVSGGTTGFGKNALSYSEIFSWRNNSWRNVAEMNTGRFGHAVVSVGEKIFAIGGDEKNPSNILDTIEEYDVEKNSWRILKTKMRRPRANFGYTLVPHSIFKGCTVSRPLDE